MRSDLRRALCTASLLACGCGLENPTVVVRPPPGDAEVALDVGLDDALVDPTEHGGLDDAAALDALGALDASAIDAPDVTPIACGMSGQGCCDDDAQPACASGLACFGGRCGCPPGSGECGGRCVETGADPAHCGGCGMACAVGANATARCAMGRCESLCADGFADCDGDETGGGGATAAGRPRRGRPTPVEAAATTLRAALAS